MAVNLKMGWKIKHANLTSPQPDIASKGYFLKFVIRAVDISKKFESVPKKIMLFIDYLDQARIN